MRNLLALLLFMPSLCLAQLPDYVPSEGLIAWYPLTQNEQDVSGNEHHLTTYGSPEWMSDVDFDYCYLNGSGTYFSHPDFSFPYQAELSISVWFRFDTWGSSGGVGSLRPVLSKHFSGYDGSFIVYMNTINQLTISPIGGHEHNWSLQEWHHLVMTLSSESMKAYVDGELVLHDTQSDIELTDDPFEIGGWHSGTSDYDSPWNGTGLTFHGGVRSTGLWGRSLSQSEVLQLYSATAPNLGCTDPTACNYDTEANVDDELCEYGCIYCGEGTVWDSTLHECVGIVPPADSILVPSPSCGEGTVWDPVNEECIIAIPADLNYDGCVSVNDLLILLAVHGTCPPYPEWPDEPTDTTWTCGDPLTYWDYDYATVLIGDQCWFAENLRTMEYSNGDTIPEVTDGSIWVSLNTDARCVFGNDENLVDTHGRLYNWHAVDDARGLCPADWHVPTDGEWTELEDYITSQGFDGTEGTVLKSEIGWQQNGNGSNDFGFSARPCGTRNHIFGNFNHGGYRGYWWSSSFGTGSERFLVFNQSVILQTGGAARHGYSVRCLKD